MVYIVMTDCKNPHAAKPFTLMNDNEDNDVYMNLRDAKVLAQDLDDVNGDGYAKVVAL